MQQDLMTILDLLKKGFTIESPEGYKITGDPENHYIDLSTPYGKDGIRILDKDGLKEAFKDYQYYLKHKDDK